MNTDALSGRLLLSVPQMLDPNFMHTVVFMCDHTEEGALGMVVNQAAPYSLAELVPDHENLAGIEFPVHLGGPVAQDTMQFLHRVPRAITAGREVAPGIYLGGEVPDLARHLRYGGEAQMEVRLFMGYSGWGAGQLEAELASGSWVVADVDRDVVFGSPDQEQTWRRVMRGLGEEGRRLSQLPPDTSWN